MVAERSLKVVVAVGLLVALAGLSASIDGDGETRRVACVDDLLVYPAVGTEEGEASGARSYAVSLPGSPLVVILRSIPREEYFSYQVRAVGYDVIEREMLAAAVILPPLEIADVSSLPASLVVFLQSEVNNLSGYDVFLNCPSG
ncbi:MAG: hypothetical protein NTY63_09210 [Candidatus Bipolaricaulota bacterium]|nr:hypothetical protein [Candidatus Bipolaricaulota bacterium]